MATHRTQISTIRRGMFPRKPCFRGNIPLLIVEICVLCVAIGVMYVVVTMTDEVNHKEIDEGIPLSKLLYTIRYARNTPLEYSFGNSFGKKTINFLKIFKGVVQFGEIRV